MDLNNLSPNPLRRKDHLLDLVLSTNPDIIENVQVVSDHEAITCQLVLLSEKPTTKELRKVYISIRFYHRADVIGINEELSNFTTYF